MRIVGYADRFSVQQGELIRFMISTPAPRYRARVVRLIHGDANPAGPGFKAEPVASTLEGEYPGQDQPIRAGSYVQVPHALPLTATGAFSLHLWLQATTPEKPRQVLFSTGADGLNLVLLAGRLTLEIAGQVVAQVERRVVRHLWYRVWATCDLARGTASLNLEPTAATATAQGGTARARLPAALSLPPAREVLIAAAWHEAGAGARDFFNGKIDCPCVFERVLGSRALAALARGVAPARLAGLVAAWDFSRDIASRRVSDVSGHGLHGRTVQMPARAVTGHDWDGSESAWRHAPGQYGAIHFHEDDLDDAGWDESARWTVPSSCASGVCYSSRLRPIVNMRPKYVMPALALGEGSPHQFNADLHLVDWLHHRGYACDVATDEDLHREGAALLARYQVILTGTHHEYWSQAMLDAMAGYLERGGRLMYLAGNGFYWVTELDPEEGHTVEIRRAGPATRTWDAAPGEGHLSTTGAPGGLWRQRGRAPQRLVGVGFTAQGTGPGRPYVQAPDARLGRGAFAFAGIAPDALIGDGPNLVNDYGAAGFELDRVDHALGSPYDTIVLATAGGFSDAYQHVSEEVTVADSRQGGTVNPLVKADMVLLPYPQGGAVFSPASIAWCGALSGNGYDNTVSRVTANVLERFLDETPI